MRQRPTVRPAGRQGVLHVDHADDDRDGRVDGVYDFSGYLPPIRSDGSVGNANTGNLYPYDPISNQYSYNLKVSSPASNTVNLIRTHLDDGTTHEVMISIKQDPAARDHPAGPPGPLRRRARRWTS